MSALGIVGMVLCVLFGFWLTKRLFVWAMVRLVQHSVAKQGLCEICFKAPRAFVCNIDDKEPFNACEVCIGKHGKYAQDALLESGKLTRVTT